MAADGSFVRSLAGLFAPFPAEAISWRVGSTTKDKSKGMALAYIDARDVMDRLDQVCGPDGWQCEYTPMANGTTCCRIGVHVAGEWVWKSNGGSATGDVDNEKEREMAEKGGYSDAFKRAAVLWGIGRYLYNLDSPWVALEAKGQSYVMAKGEREKLDRAYANYLRRHPPLQPISARPDAGQRETPDDEQKAAAETVPPDPAAAKPARVSFTASSEDDGLGKGKSAYRAKKDGDWERVRDRLMEELKECATRGAAIVWWEGVVATDDEYRQLPQTFRKTFRDEFYIPHMETLDEDGPQTTWDDAPMPEER